MIRETYVSVNLAIGDYCYTLWFFPFYWRLRHIRVEFPVFSEGYWAGPFEISVSQRIYAK